MAKQVNECDWCSRTNGTLYAGGFILCRKCHGERVDAELARIIRAHDARKAAGYRETEVYAHV